MGIRASSTSNAEDEFDQNQSKPLKQSDLLPDIHHRCKYKGQEKAVIRTFTPIVRSTPSLRGLFVARLPAGRGDALKSIAGDDRSEPGHAVSWNTLLCATNYGRLVNCQSCHLTGL